MTSSKARGEQKRSDPKLSRGEVARAALALADRDGLEALSMRRLAGELGVGTMTLYGYFRDKEELLDAIVEVASEEVRLERVEGNWQAQLRVIAREIRRLLSRHPVGVRIRFTRACRTNPRSVRPV